MGGDAERAIEWGEKALRLSPFDPWNWMSWHAVFLGNFQQGRYEDSANAMRKSIQCNPSFSISYMFLAAALAKLGRIEEAKASAARLIALQPTFAIGEWRAAIDPVPILGEPLCHGAQAAGLPE
jgi:adenylate cyclase